MITFLLVVFVLLLWVVIARLLRRVTDLEAQNNSQSGRLVALEARLSQLIARGSTVAPPSPPAAAEGDAAVARPAAPPLPPVIPRPRRLARQEPRSQALARCSPRGRLPRSPSQRLRPPPGPSRGPKPGLPPPRGARRWPPRPGSPRVPRFRRLLPRHAAAGASRAVRLGRPGRREALLLGGRHRAGARRDLLPRLLDSEWLAAAARSRWRSASSSGSACSSACEMRVARR